MCIEEEIYNKLVEQFGIGEICIKKRGKSRINDLTWLEFIKVAINLTPYELAKFCGFNSVDNLGEAIRNKYHPILLIKQRRQWKQWLLSIIHKKRCSKCLSIKALNEFNGSTKEPDGIRSECRHCESTYYKVNKEKISIVKNQHYIKNKSVYIAAAAKRRATKLQATPKWADLEAIKEIYKNCPEGFHVDHVIPLQGELVCGLHVHKNLKPIPAAENLAKSNKYTIL